MFQCKYVQVCDWFPSMGDIKDAILFFGAPSDIFHDIIDECLKLPHAAEENPVIPNKMKSSAFSKKNVSSCSKTRIGSCFYCKKKDALLHRHPYVPLKFNGGSVLICDVCLDKWNFFRQHAELNNMLLLSGETNEEHCALCSASPKQVVVCSHCVRSYCKKCLKKLLTKAELADVKKPDDWKCMSCAGVSAADFRGPNAEELHCPPIGLNESSETNTFSFQVCLEALNNWLTCISYIYDNRSPHHEMRFVHFFRDVIVSLVLRSFIP